MDSRKPDHLDGKPEEDRDVQSDQPYYEESSVPGDNDPATDLDKTIERKK